MKTPFLLGVVGLLAAGIGIAIAQQPTNNLVSPTGAEAINTYTNTLLSQVYSTQLRDAVGYQKITNTAVPLTFAYGQSLMQIPGASTISALTINLATKPVDGQLNCFYTKPAITTLTLTASQTLNDAVTAVGATSQICYLFSTSNNAWDRVQ